MTQSIIDKVQKIQERIENACIANGRSPQEVRLLLATKTVNAAKIKTVLAHGETLIGENKVQEIKEKYAELLAIPHEKHFIGHLQSNKINDILKHNVTCIQSLDRLSLAEKLQKRLERDDSYIDAFIQVNTSNEDSKFGIPPEESLRFAEQLSKLDRIRIKGLMTIGLFSDDLVKVRACFQRLNAVQEEISKANLPNINVKELSMGMSGDLEIAISEGATIVRVGTAIFGERIYPDSYYWNEKK